ncbi:MAG: DUF1064 domain-containing protein [Telluria sp.]
MTRRSKNWTAADLALAQAGGGRPTVAAPAKQSKYRNRKVTVGGVTFDSAGEQRRYAELCLLQEGGHIAFLTLGQYFVLAPACHLGGKSKKPALRYKADFTYVEDDGTLVVEDFKSPATLANPVYRIKKHLMMTVHGILIRESRK